LLSIGLTLRVILAEATENTTVSNEQETTMKPPSGVISNIVGGILKPVNPVLPPSIASSALNVADILDYNLKAIYPGKVHMLVNIPIH
jgi:hypothetical protein